MRFNLCLESEALIDIQEAFLWYEEQRKGLGDLFLEELENSYSDIAEHPQCYSAINETFRRARLHKFPYWIIYEIEDNTIFINAVRHMSRKPRY